MKVTLINNIMKFNTPAGIAVVEWIPYGRSGYSAIVTVGIIKKIYKTSHNANKTNAKYLIEQTLKDGSSIA